MPVFKNFFKAFDILKKLHIGLYLYFVIAVIAVEYPIGLFESYSLIDARNVNNIVTRLAQKVRKEKPGSDPRSFGLNINNQVRYELPVPHNDEPAKPGSTGEILILTNTGGRDILDDYKNGLQFTTSNGLIDVLISARPAGGFALNLKRRLEKKAIDKFPWFGIFENGFILPAAACLIVVWMWPYYRFSFSPVPGDPAAAEKRIINLPVFILALIWLFAAFKLAVKSTAYWLIITEFNPFVILMFFVSFLIFGTITSLLSIGSIQQYINDRIAAPFFEKHDPYSIRSGYSISLTLRFLIIIFCIGVFPTILGVYLPMSFNVGLLSDTGNALKMLDNFDKIVPVLMMCFFAFYFLAMQAVSVFSFRKNIITPVNNLVRRMKQVSKGDFNCKTSVLYVDEIGQLKGHFNLMLDGLIEREKVKDTFGKFISFEIAEKLMKNEKLNLMGEEVEATILFSDIRDFTPLSESLTPEKLVEFLNLYFSHIVGPIHKNHGIINKFMGDAVMAIFSPLFGETDHEKAAVRAGLEMKNALGEFNCLKKYPHIKSGIGIHTGKLIAGNIGTQERMEYTFIGDNVNIAARIESETKNFKTDILISKNVIDKLKKEEFPGVDFVEHGPVLMKGKSVPLILYGISLK